MYAQLAVIFSVINASRIEVQCRSNMLAKISERPVSSGDTVVTQSDGHKLAKITARILPFGNFESKVSASLDS